MPKEKEVQSRGMLCLSSWWGVTPSSSTSTDPAAGHGQDGLGEGLGDWGHQ